MPFGFPLLGERYQVVGLLGKGGFSEVYKAFDIETSTYRAVKLHKLSGNMDLGQRNNYLKHAQRELKVHQSIQHENIVRMYETIEVNNQDMATILELCDGPDLSSYLKRKGTLPEKEAKNIIRQVLQALKYLDELSTGKIIHYDLKPGNILFKGGFVKVADFGLCKELQKGTQETELTSFGTGTYWYLPPEAFLDTPHSPVQITTKLDIWSVGVIYYELLFGRKPYGHGMHQRDIMSNKIILKASKVEFPSKPIISAEAKHFITNCLAYHPEDRFDVNAAIDHLTNPQKSMMSQPRE